MTRQSTQFTVPAGSSYKQPILLAGASEIITATTTCIATFQLDSEASAPGTDTVVDLTLGSDEVLLDITAIGAVSSYYERRYVVRFTFTDGSRIEVLPKTKQRRIYCIFEPTTS